jgi:peroxiredoxin
VSRSTRLLPAITALLLVSAAPALALSIGDVDPTPAVKLKNVDGRDLTLAGAAGEKGLLVVFTCNHCPWVRAWEDRLVALGNSYPAKGIGVVAVNPNDPSQFPADGFPEMQARARESGYAFPYAMDTTSDVGRAFGATHTPEAFLFDARGKLVYHGAIDDNARHPDEVQHHYLRDALDALLAGRPIAVSESKALGCSIVLRKKQHGRGGA